MRDIPLKTVKIQFKRILDGGVTLTPYNFSYTSYLEHDDINPLNISFNVIPNSYPPTNIHVLIGRNGVGKTRLIKNIINCIIDENNDVYGRIQDESIFNAFSLISFSSFIPKLMSTFGVNSFPFKIFSNLFINLLSLSTFISILC